MALKLFLTLLLSLWISPAFGAVTIDTANKSHVQDDNPTEDQTMVTQIDWPHTVSGSCSDATLIAMAYFEDATSGDVTINSFTYNGVSMTQAAYSWDDTVDSGVAIYYLANPATGTNTISLTMSGTNIKLGGSAVAFCNTDTTDPIGLTESTFAQNSLAISDSMTIHEIETMGWSDTSSGSDWAYVMVEVKGPTATDSYIVDAAILDQGSSSAPVPRAEQNVLWNYGFAGATSNQIASSYRGRFSNLAYYSATTNTQAAGVGTTMTYSVTVPSGKDNLYMLIHAAGQNGTISLTDITSVTYNGDSATEIAEAEYSQSRNSLWKLPNPDVGTHDLVVTIASSASPFGVSAMIFEGADQSSNPETYDTDGECCSNVQNPSGTITGTTANGMVIGALWAGTGSAFNFSALSGKEKYEINAASVCKLVGQTIVSPGGSIDVDYSSGGGFSKWGIVMASLIEATGGGEPPAEEEAIYYRRPFLPGIMKGIM